MTQSCPQLSVQSLGPALSAERVAVRAAWVEAHKALFPGNAVLRQQVRSESVGYVFVEESTFT